MRIHKRNSYRGIYLLNAFLIGLTISIGAFTTGHATTYADEDPITEISDSHFVTIHDQGQQLTIKTDAATVRDALDRASLSVEESDLVEPGLDERINSDNFQINIYRSRPVLVIDGIAKKTLMTASYDPKTIALEAGLTLYDGDLVELDSSVDLLQTGVTAAYKVTRNGGQTITVESTIPFTEETVKNPELDLGQSKVTQPGEDGRKVTKYQVQFKDGVEISRELVSEEVVKQPVPRITAEGTKQPVPPEWETCAAWAREAGVSEADLYNALTLIYKESGCRVSAENAASGAYGIPQALPGSKMASAGADWQTNPVTQIRWMISYVVGRYGGWSQALAYWYAHGNY